MIIFESTFRDLIIQANVGVDQRVFLGQAPQKPAPETLAPYMVFFIVGPHPYVTQDGPLTLLERDYQVSIFHPSQTTALAIGDTLRMYLDGFRGTFENVNFGHIFYDLQTFTFEPDTRLWHVIQEYRIMYRILPTAVRTAVTNRRSHYVNKSRGRDTSAATTAAASGRAAESAKRSDCPDRRAAR